MEHTVLLYGVINVGEHANWRRCICCTPCSVKTYIYVLFKIVHFFSGWNIYVSDLRYSILCKNIAYSGKRESIINTKNLIRKPNTTLWFGFHQLLKSLILAIRLTVLKICFILQKWKINIAHICWDKSNTLENKIYICTRKDKYSHSYSNCLSKIFYSDLRILFLRVSNSSLQLRCWISSLMSDKISPLMGRSEFSLVCYKWREISFFTLTSL